MKIAGIFYSLLCVVLAIFLFSSMESSTYQMNFDLRIVARAVYYVGIVVTIGMAGLPWIFNKN